MTWAHAPDLGRMAISLPERTTTAVGSLTPREIVAELDKYVIGQAKAKRAVAIALRNRLRRQRLPGRDRRRSHAQEHPDDRTDRCRENRDRAATGAARALALHQGRGLEVHRGRIRRSRRRIDGPRSRGARRRHGARGEGRGGAGEGARRRRGPPARPAAAALAAAHARRGSDGRPGAVGPFPRSPA